MSHQTTPQEEGELGEALEKLHEVILEGLKHGFFDCSISCELIRGRKRRLTIRAGRSYQFTIAQEELEK